ncbi:hypothetical protein R9C00_24645 [Flammeovirgaceae bacterium SG7u.111]|nr:hypothetical protein [Flammeovirgaceae bacterium SG7u.132]WPO34888.1 hypothetical protein R9C00_24645 [Flammeovirgaceae bacterium SG7u.111]
MLLRYKTKITWTVLCLAFLLSACGGSKRERFNYTLIKSKLSLSEEQVGKFDEITSNYLKKAREAYESNSGNREEVKKAVEAVFQEQDRLIGEVLNEDQFAIYTKEIKIEREGREKYNMTVIRDQLGLDSAQTVQYDLANEAFYTLLIENHDNYHGKPDVYLQYYAEIDVSRQEAFQKLMNKNQYGKYQELAEEYKIGKSEAY